MSSFRPMIGHLLAFAIIVDGKDGTSAKFTEDEKTSVLRDVYASVGVLQVLGAFWAGIQSPNVQRPFGITVVPKFIQIRCRPGPHGNPQPHNLGRRVESKT